MLLSDTTTDRCYNCNYGLVNLSSCDCLAKLIGLKPGQTKGNSESEVLVIVMANTVATTRDLAS